MTEDIKELVLAAEEEEAPFSDDSSERLPLVDAEDVSPEEKTAILQKAKRMIEALLFCTTEPVTLRRISNVLQSYHPIDTSEVKRLLEELANEYRDQNRGFRLDEIAKGYILRSCEEFSPYIHALLKISRPERLSHAATEVLAIIAFRQPITRPQIDEIRGVDSSGIISTLIERQLIEPTGKLEVAGRPTLYGITNHFLKYFGMKDLKELPSIHLPAKAAPSPEPPEEQEREGVQPSELGEQAHPLPT
jgi:segregation and condensation protein B